MKTQKVIKVEEKQKITDDEDLVEYISSPTDHTECATVTTSVITSPSQSAVNLDPSIKTEANITADSAVQYGKLLWLSMKKFIFFCMTSVKFVEFS